MAKNKKPIIKNSKKKNTKSPTKKRVKFSVFELKIPKQHYPKKQGNKSKEFAKKARKEIGKLHDIELGIEFILMNIKNSKSILFSKKRSNRPMNKIAVNKFIVDIDTFEYEYENYCFRVYIYRETIWQFIAQFLDIKNNNFFNFLKDSKIRDIGLDKILYRFEKTKDLKDVISSRNRTIHKLTDSIEEKKLDDLLKKFDLDKKLVNRSLDKIIKINKDITEKINEYKKNKLKK